MPLSINTTRALIGIDRTPSRLDIQTVNARLELKTNKAKVSITTEKPQVIIDQYEAFASAGLKNNFDRAKEIVQRAYQQVMETIGRTAEDGKMLAAIEKGGNPIAAIAKRDAWPVHEFGMDTIPKVGPKFDVKSSFNIEWNVDEIEKGVEGNYSPGKVNINYAPAIIEVYMKQYPAVEIQYTGSKVDMTI